jgi:hypothetical protein
MSDPIHLLHVLHNNPFIFAPVISNFYMVLGEKENSFLLGYLILPITLHQPSHKFLNNANSRSSLRTMLKDRGSIYGLDERVALYRKITNTTIQHLLGTGSISVHSQVEVTSADSQILDGPSPGGVIKAARRLGTFFQPYDVPTVFRMLGVMSL